MNIIFNTDQVYLHGGIEKTMATKANYFANLPDVKVYIVTTEQGDAKSRYPLDKRIELVDLGINYDRSLSYFSKENLKKVFQHFRRQKATFKVLKPDVVISPNFNYDHYWLPFITPKTKLIKERHGSRYAEEDIRVNASFFGKLKFYFDDWIDAQYDHIIVLNKDEKSYVRSGNGIVIPNSVSIPNHKAGLINKGVIAAGRISPVKAFDELIKAWKIVAGQFPDWELHIYGEDYLGTKEKLMELIDSLKLQKTIVFKESVEDLPHKMLDYSIYAMSSVTECFPMVLLEALSVGLPIVSYDCPNGPRNIITDNADGILVENKNSENLAKKLMLLIGDETKRLEMGSNAIENVKRFDNKTVMDFWCNLLHLPNV